MSHPWSGHGADPGADPAWDPRVGWEELARADGVLGDLLLRRRPAPDGLLIDLVCAGVDVMDDQQTASERALAALALDEVERLAAGAGGAAGTADAAGADSEGAGAGDAAGAGAAGAGGTGLRVVVGGLGLGFTAAALLADPRLGADGRVTVVEVEPAVVAWNRAGLVPATAGTTDDPRLEVVVGDVADVLPDLARRDGAVADAVLLDVDNGPGFLVVPDNARLYEPAGLVIAASPLRVGGVLAVWSAQEAPELHAALEEVVGPAVVRVVGVRREGRHLDYYVHLASRRG